LLSQDTVIENQDKWINGNEGNSIFILVRALGHDEQSYLSFVKEQRKKSRSSKIEESEEFARLHPSLLSYVVLC